MIKFSDISSNGFNTVTAVGHGDGIASVVSLNLSKAPFDVNFNGVLPTDFLVFGLAEGFTGTAEITQNLAGDNILTVTYNQPLPDTVVNPSNTMLIGVQFIYSSLA